LDNLFHEQQEKFESEQTFEGDKQCVWLVYNLAHPGKVPKVLTASSSEEFSCSEKVNFCKKRGHLPKKHKAQTLKGVSPNAQVNYGMKIRLAPR